VLGNRVEMVEKKRKKNRFVDGTEVANAAHVKLALEYDIDVLWVGARTTVTLLQCKISRCFTRN
jgi:3-deoxy-D-arabino-heptulosonate 7-phosphate (DAHP) synthase